MSPVDMEQLDLFTASASASGNGSGVPEQNDSISGVVVIPRDNDNLALCAIITVVMQMSFYLVACICKFDKVTDFAGGSNFALLAAVTFGLSGTYNARQILVTVLVLLWAIRLTGFLLIRIFKIGKDSRFDKIRENPLKFLVFWLFQMLWVYIVSLPVIFINSPTSVRVSIGPTDYVGAVLFVVGFALEVSADTHKFIFRINPSNDGKWCDVGLWKVSRHPNYLGEIVLWWGAFIISALILRGAKWVAVLSPIFITSLLMFFTGIPPLEKSSDEKYGGNEDYRKYKKCTPPLVPGVPPLYLMTPYLLKLIFCCEFPFYNFLPSGGRREQRPALSIPINNSNQPTRYGVAMGVENYQVGSMSHSVPVVTPPSSMGSVHMHNINAAS